VDRVSSPHYGPIMSDEPRWLDDTEQRAWWALLEVGSGLFDLLTRDLKAIGGLTLDDYEVLHLLSNAEDRRLRIGDLSTMMLASRTGLSQRIDRLTERGWVVRLPCPEDRRVIWVVLTDEGYEFLVSVAPQHLEQVRRHVFDHLTRTDVEAIGRSLSKVAEHLHNLRTTGR